MFLFLLAGRCFTLNLEKQRYILIYQHGHLFCLNWLLKRDEILMKFVGKLGGDLPNQAGNDCDNRLFLIYAYLNIN